MSTEYYLECLDHDPPILSEEVGYHPTALVGIREWIAKRDLYAGLADPNLPISFDDPCVSAAARFLRDHSKCRIGIRDEYGREHSP